MAYKKLKYWFDKELAELLAEKITSKTSSFDSKAFIHSATTGLEPLELKDRVEKMADALHRGFNGDYPKGAASLIKILGPENEKETGMFTEYYWVMPIAKFVEKYGLVDFEVSMHAIEEITKRNTGEYAIRPYLEKHQQKTLAQMKAWSINPNVHVRRLSSEGVRPRLPWAKKLDAFIDNPKPIIPILNTLKDDPSRFVQKSVANCLNDILKDNYEMGKDVIERWNTKRISKERKWIIKHALRNLIKSNDAWAIQNIQ